MKRWLRAARRILDRTLLRPLATAGLSNMLAITKHVPMMVNIETTTICNARCTFCAYPKLSRPKDIMTMELFETICSQVGDGYLGFSPLMSDCLTDPMLFDRLRLAKSKYPKVKLHIFTNGIRLIKLSDSDIVRLLTYLEYINISIGGFSAEDYKTMFGVDKFYDVMAGLGRLARVRKDIKSKCRLILHFRTNKKAEMLKHPTLKNLRKLGFECDDFLDAFSNWGGVIKPEHIPAGATLVETDNHDKKTACIFPMVEVVILPDGRVSGCGCMDAQGSVIIGDVTKNRLADVWQSKAALDFRHSFENGKVYDLCKTCAYYTNSHDFFEKSKFATFKHGQNVWS